MGKILKISTKVTTIILIITLGSMLHADAEGSGTTTQPGTADDPVVTKSYVDQQIQKVLGGGAVTAPTATTVPSATTAPSTPSQPAASGNALEIVEVKAGQTLIAAAGAEFIVRAGKAVTYTQDANGVADLTDGKDLTNGQVAPTNHLLSFPREGRGIAVQDNNKYGLVVMVRGGYTLQ